MTFIPSTVWRYALVSWLMILCTPAYAERLAVLKISGEVPSESFRRILADKIRAGVLDAAPRIQVMTKENMLDMLNSMGKNNSCIKGECEVELARNIGVHYFITGELAEIGGLYILSLNLHDTHKGNLLAAESIDASDYKALIGGVRDLGANLTHRGLKKRKRKQVKRSKGLKSDSDEEDWNPDDETLVTVRFESNPNGAAVLYEGDLICKTPCSQDVPKGSIALRFSKMRYTSEMKRVTARNGTVVSVDLTPKFGWFSVLTKPSGIKLALNGKDIGKSPIRKREIDSGLHRLSVKDPCYKPMVHQFKIRANSHKNNFPIFTIKPKFSAIRVSARRGSNAVFAHVYVDGEKRGQTGEAIKVPLCSNRVEVRTQEGETWRKQLRLKENQTSRIQAKFRASRRHDLSARNSRTPRRESPLRRASSIQSNIGLKLLGYGGSIALGAVGLAHGVMAHSDRSTARSLPAGHADISAAIEQAKHNAFIADAAIISGVVFGLVTAALTAD